MAEQSQVAKPTYLSKYNLMQKGHPHKKNTKNKVNFRNILCVADRWDVNSRLAANRRLVLLTSWGHINGSTKRTTLDLVAFIRGHNKTVEVLLSKGAMQELRSQFHLKPYPPPPLVFLYIRYRNSIAQQSVSTTAPPSCSYYPWQL